MQTLLVFDDTAPFALAAALVVREALAARGEVTVASLCSTAPESVPAANLLVVGGANQCVDGAPEGQRLRDWFARLPAAVAGMPAAAYEVRLAAQVRGRCAEGVNRQLHLHHFHVIAPPGQFLAGADGTFTGAARERALQWAEAVARWGSTVVERTHARV